MAAPSVFWEPSGFRSDLFFSHLISGDAAGVRKVLLVDRSHVHMEDGCGRSALTCAQFLSDPITCRAITQLLIDFGARHRSRDPNTGLDALGWACRLGRATSVPLLLDLAAIDIDFLRGQDSHGNTYLHLAISSGSHETVRRVADAMIYLAIGVDAPMNNDGLSPFLFALKEGENSLAEVLVKSYGAQSNQFDDHLLHDEEGWRKVGGRKRRHREKLAERQLWIRHRIEGRLQLAPSLPSPLPPPPPPPPKTKAERGLSMAQLLAAWAEQRGESWRPSARPESPVLLGEAEQRKWSTRTRKGPGRTGRRARHSITDPVMPGARKWRLSGEFRRKQSLQIGHLGEQGRGKRRSFTLVPTGE